MGQIIHASSFNGENGITFTIKGEAGIYFVELLNNTGELAIFKVAKK